MPGPTWALTLGNLVCHSVSRACMPAAALCSKMLLRGSCPRAFTSPVLPAIAGCVPFAWCLK
eukprot:2870174-Alexandrium_andersonii.AAC.1